MRRSVPTLLCLTLITLTGCSDEVIGDAASLRAELEVASPGDHLRLGGGEFMGPFTIPAGVRLEGEGQGRTRIVGPSDRPPLRLIPGPTATVVSKVTVRANGDFGVVATGAGDVELNSVAIDVPVRGAGFGAEDVSSVVLTGVSVRGPVTSDNAEGMPLEPSIDDSATHGMVLVGVDLVTAEDVEVGGFAYVGVLAVDCGGSWLRGSVSGNLGTGLLVYGGSMHVRETDLSGALQGTRLIPAYNAVFAGDAAVTTESLRTSNSQGYGVLQAAATATHSGLSAVNNANAALWVQDSDGFSLEGGMLEGSGMAGVVALDSTNVDVDGVEILSTRALTRVYGSTPVEVGDGVHLLRSTSAVAIRNSTLANNARVGLLLDVGIENIDGITVEAVTVDGDGEQLGAIAQGAMVTDGWDTGISRLGATVGNDASFLGELDTVGIVGPSDIPAVSSVLSDGLVGIVGPSD